MRYLTVKRKWSIFKGFSRITLYVQCPKEYSSHNIGIKYFREYKLRNGGKLKAQIFDFETIIIVDSGRIATKYVLPAGTEDVRFSTKPDFQPRRGYPFYLTRIEDKIKKEKPPKPVKIPKTNENTKEEEILVEEVAEAATEVIETEVAEAAVADGAETVVTEEPEDEFEIELNEVQESDGQSEN